MRAHHIDATNTDYYLYKIDMAYIYTVYTAVRRQQKNDWQTKIE